MSSHLFFMREELFFCTNDGSEGAINYSNSGSGRYNIFFVPNEKINKKGGAKLFSGQLKSKYNDGPVTFSPDGTAVFFSRNITSKSDKKAISNLGIYFASLDKKKWGEIRDTRYNSESYNVTTPCFSPDGQRLFFASDMPGGHGGVDLYYCELFNGFLGNPINLGSEINTEGNESFPFMNSLGELFFASDGHPGLGGKDIFVTKQNGDTWHKPERLEAPINSEFNDFGILTDTLFNQGYFSSDRDGTHDIFSFNTKNHPIWFSKPQLSNNYCVTLSENKLSPLDSVNLIYEWEFEDHTRLYGNEVKFCFEGSGTHQVKLNLVEKSTGEFFFHKKTFRVRIDDNEQPFIQTEDYATVGQEITLDATKSVCSNCKIVDYYWDLGDRTYVKGNKTYHSFKDEGEYEVKLGLVVKSDTDGSLAKKSVSKTIKVFANNSEKELFEKRLAQTQVEKEKQSNQIAISETFNDDLNERDEIIYKLEVLTSKQRYTSQSNAFDRIPFKYSISEIYDQKEGVYKYFVDEQRDLISLYPAFKEMLSIGLAEVKIVKEKLKHPAQIEFSRLLRRNGVSMDQYFDSRNIFENQRDTDGQEFVGLIG